MSQPLLGATITAIGCALFMLIWIMTGGDNDKHS